VAALRSLELQTHLSLYRIRLPRNNYTSHTSFALRPPFRIRLSGDIEQLTTMPSARRLKAFFLLVLISVLITLYLTASARQTRTSQFYTKTQDALAAARAVKEVNIGDMPGGSDADVGKRLREAEEAAKQAADRKGDAFHGEEGRRQASIVRDKQAKETVAPATTDDEVPKEKPRVAKVPGLALEEGLKKQAAENKKMEAESTAETEEDHKVKDELNLILKKSPSTSLYYPPFHSTTNSLISTVIIFSKSYCPHSARAKRILLESYDISPPPFVVELDLHPLGAQLQSKLADMTGRRTVPNVLINGKSIGGGDDVAALHDSGTLIEKVTSMGGKRMVVTAVEEAGLANERRRVRV
jgi:glutaredoxin